MGKNRARCACAVVAACSALLGCAASASASLPPIKHVFIIIGENESESTSFGASSPAPYLARTLTSEGAYLQNYYATGHASLDNYIAMVSGQAPNPSTSADCGTFADFPADVMTAGQENGSGCVYPTDVPTIMSQLDTAGLSWRGYMDSMGLDPTRESATCGHPAVGAPDLTEAKETTPPYDQYATRHDPFVYFHYVIDNAVECNADVVNLSQLPTDLTSASTTPNYVFITPGLCDDGHDSSGCPPGETGGLPQFDQFLQTWVPRILASPAYQQDGMLIVTFDESVGDNSFCCGESAGPSGSAFGGGVVGAVALSRYITPGTVSMTKYNHFSMLGTVEDLFGLSRIGEANGPAGFGSDVFTNPTGVTGPTGPTGPTGTSGTSGPTGPTSVTGTTNPAPTPVAPQLSGLKIKPAAVKAKQGATISYTDTKSAITTLTVQVHLGGYRKGSGSCKALAAGRKRPKHTKACTLTKTVGSFTHSDAAGANAIKWNVKVSGKTLKAGSYTLTATPVAGTLRGATSTIAFKVVAAPAPKKTHHG